MAFIYSLRSWESMTDLRPFGGDFRGLYLVLGDQQTVTYLGRMLEFLIITKEGKEQRNPLFKREISSKSADDVGVKKHFTANRFQRENIIIFLTSQNVNERYQVILGIYCVGLGSKACMGKCLSRPVYQGVTD